MANQQKMTLDQFEAFASTLPEGADRRKVARALGLTLPVEVPPLADQLKEAAVVKHTPKASKANPKPTEKTYVSIPSLQIDEATGTRSFWVNAEVARQVFARGLEICDEAGL